MIHAYNRDKNMGDESNIYIEVMLTSVNGHIEMELAGGLSMILKRRRGIEGN